MGIILYIFQTSHARGKAFLYAALFFFNDHDFPRFAYPELPLLSIPFAFSLLPLLLHLAIDTIHPIDFLACLFPVLLLFLPFLFLLRILLFLLLPVLDLILYQIVERRDGPYQTGQINRHQLIVRLDRHGAREFRIATAFFPRSAAAFLAHRLRGGGGGVGEVGQEVEDVLEVAEDGVVDGEFLVDYLLEVLADVAEAEVQALEGLQLGGDAGGKGANGDVADVAEEVLDADFFGFFGFDYGRGVHEGFCRGRAVLFPIPER